MPTSVPLATKMLRRNHLHKLLEEASYYAGDGRKSL